MPPQNDNNPDIYPASFCFLKFSSNSLFQSAIALDSFRTSSGHHHSLSTCKISRQIRPTCSAILQLAQNMKLDAVCGWERSPTFRFPPSCFSSARDFLFSINRRAVCHRAPIRIAFCHTSLFLSYRPAWPVYSFRQFWQQR